METDENKTPEDKKNPSEEIKDKMIRSAHTEDMIDHYWGSINYVFSLIKASELKAGLLLSFYGILLNFIFKNIEITLVGFKDNIVFYILILLWFVCTAVSIYYCVRCFMPKIEAKYDKNIFFFKDVISKFGSIKEFSNTFYNISLDENQLFDHLGQQIYINSKIADNKFKYINHALHFLGYSLALLLISGIYYLFSTLI